MDMSRIELEHAAPAAPGSSERREGKRHTSVLLIGRADFGRREHACLVHNISERGLMARFLTPPAMGETISVQLRGLGPVDATVRWINGACAGVEFATPQSLQHVLGKTAPGEQRARTPRFDLSRAAKLEVDGVAHEAVVIDVSVGGAKLIAEPRFRVGSHARLGIVDTHLLFAGTICWQQDEHVGFQFVKALTLQRLADVIDLEENWTPDDSIGASTR